MMMVADPIAGARNARVALLQLGVLIVASALVLREEAAGIFVEGWRDPEMAHLLVAPILIGLLIFLRRDRLREALSSGSSLGIVLMLVGILVWFVSGWPYNFLQPRRLSFAIMVAGAIVTTCGWRVLRLSLPMLVILMLAIPIGMRFLAAIIVRPLSSVLLTLSSAVFPRSSCVH